MPRYYILCHYYNIGEYVNKTSCPKHYRYSEYTLVQFQTLCKWSTGYIFKNCSCVISASKFVIFWSHNKQSQNGCHLLGFYFGIVCTFKWDLLSRVSFLYGCFWANIWQVKLKARFLHARFLRARFLQVHLLGARFLRTPFVRVRFWVCSFWKYPGRS